MSLVRGRNASCAQVAHFKTRVKSETRLALVQQNSVPYFESSAEEGAGKVERGQIPLSMLYAEEVCVCWRE